jgi:hypothetical protein
MVLNGHERSFESTPQFTLNRTLTGAGRSDGVSRSPRRRGTEAPAALNLQLLRGPQIDQVVLRYFLAADRQHWPDTCESRQ